MWAEVIRYAEVTSTNDLARDHALLGVPEGTAVVAGYQHQGRGRLGRTWHSPPDLSLLCSFVLRPAPALCHSAWLTLIGGIAAAEAVREVADAEARLKWPNDVRLGGRKLGGVLAETVREGGNGPVCILGLGLNVNQQAEDLPEELRETATSLRLATDREWPLDDLFTSLAARLKSCYDALCRGEVEAVRVRWRELDETLGQSVVVEGADGEWHGRATAVDEHGALWIEDAVGDARRVVVGDVSIRLQGA